MPRPRILRQSDLRRKVRKPRPRVDRRKPPLRIPQILAWAKAHHARTGQWPMAKSGEVRDVPWQTWSAVQAALHYGWRGLPKGLTIARLLWKHLGVRNGPPPLTIKQILAWADEHHAHTGRWPNANAGPIAGAARQTWAIIDGALSKGLRSLRGGSSLIKLLTEHRGVRSRTRPPPLTLAQVLRWADRHHARTGQWPRRGSGPIANAPGEIWLNVDGALLTGQRGLPRGSSLDKLLLKERSVRGFRGPPLSVPQILRWADEHHARTGRWPHMHSGPIPNSLGETWTRVTAALRTGQRGLAPGGWSLTRLLHEKRGARMLKSPPRLLQRTILNWADDHHRRTGAWPHQKSGPLLGQPEENWPAIDAALRLGLRGLPRGSSLPALLERHRGVRNRKNAPPLTVKQILAAADEHQRRTGRWPNYKSGPIAALDGETWVMIANALRRGTRGLPRGSSLPRLLAQYRNQVNRLDKPRLTVRQILEWADRHHQRTGQWPRIHSGPVRDAPGETWGNIHAALRTGSRGLVGHSSLARLLDENRDAPHWNVKPPLKIDQILRWARAYHRVFGRWPSKGSGRVIGVPHETWLAIDGALHQGRRSLRGGSSLARLLAQHALPLRTSS